MATAPFELWRIELGAEPDEAALRCLSEEERTRAERFVFARHRRRYRAAHVALRELLAHRLGVAPAALAFGAGPFGKPFVIGAARCAFNLSHSDDVALLGFADEGELGVDVEMRRAMRDARQLAERHFAVSEQAELAAAAAAEGDLAFLRGWTRKEACLKAVGSGLSIAPETFVAGLAPVRRRVQVAAAEVDVWTIDAGDDVVAAVARVA